MAAGRLFTIPFTSTVTNAGGNTDLWEVVAAAGHPLRIRGIMLGQTSELGDTAEESLDVSILRMTATVTSGSGTAAAPESVESNALAPSFAAETNGATVATTSGSTDIIERWAWNLRNSPYPHWYPDVDFAPKCDGSQGLFVRLNSTVVDDITFVGTLWVEEL